MEYNFEDQLNRKLNSRTIAPSEAAWNRIANRDRKKKTNNNKWYWMAAAIVIGVASYLNIGNHESAPTQSIVIIERHQPEEMATDTNMAAPTVPLIQQRVFVAEPISKKVIVEMKATQPETIVLQRPMTVFQMKANEIAVSLEQMQHSGTEITEQMLDSMIRKAHMEIVAERVDLSQQKTDPSALLGESEKEIDKSFKDRIFDALHGKIKIAFGERKP